MKKVVYPGSFDPVTMGHIGIIKRLSRLFDEVVVTISQTHSKKYFFSPLERKKLVECATSNLKNVCVDVCAGFVVEYAQSIGAAVIVRSVRGPSDFEREGFMAAYNKGLNDSIETLLMISDPKFSHISSSGVREIAFLGGDIDMLAPKEVKAAFQKACKKDDSPSN